MFDLEPGQYKVTTIEELYHEFKNVQPEDWAKDHRTGKYYILADGESTKANRMLPANNSEIHPTNEYLWQVVSMVANGCSRSSARSTDIFGGALLNVGRLRRMTGLSNERLDYFFSWFDEDGLHQSYEVDGWSMRVAPETKVTVICR